MHDIPMIDFLRALGASPEAMRALWTLVAYAGLVVAGLALGYKVLLITFEMGMDRLNLRDRALDRLCAHRRIAAREHVAMMGSECELSMWLEREAFERGDLDAAARFAEHAEFESGVAFSAAKAVHA